jgi:hypothetical protein
MEPKDKFSLTRKRGISQPSPARTQQDFVEGTEPHMMKTFRIPVRLAHKLKVYSSKTRQTDTKVIVGLLEQLLREESDE